MYNKNLTLIEDHHQALKIWQKLKIKNLSLVHLDSHIDFGFYRAKPVRQALEEAKSLKDLKRQLEKTLLHLRYQDDLEAQLNIGNYIYPAMRDGIVDRFYWIIPGNNEKFKSSLKDIKNLTKRLKFQDHYKDRVLTLGNNKVSTKLYGRYFEVTDIFSAPKIEEPIILDIDVDYLLFDSIKNISLTKNIGRRKPWIYPDRLAELIKEKFLKAGCTTIAYSVNGGFTPIEYKFFGDELYLRITKSPFDKTLERIFYLRNRGIDRYFKNDFDLSIADLNEAVGGLRGYKYLSAGFKSSFLAHLYFWLFRISWKMGKKKYARKYYQKVIENDPSYRCKDNNNGWLYWSKGNLKSASDEFKKINFCDPKDYYALCGMGDILLRHRKYKDAEDKYIKAVRLKPEEKQAFLGLASIYICLNKLRKAENILSRLKKIEPFNTGRLILEAELNKKKGNLKKALILYKESVMFGAGNIKIYDNAFKILRVEKDKELFKYFEHSYKTFKKNFYKNQKKFLLEEKRLNQLDRLANGFKKIDKIINLY